MGERPRLTVGALVINPQGEVLLLKSQKWEGRYILPCGHVEHMETLEKAVRREVKEETGLIIHTIKFLHLLEFLNPKQFHKKQLHFVGIQYTCKTNNTKVILNDEAQEHLWTKPKNALTLNLEESTKKSIQIYLTKN